ncbi:MAG: class I SAM-dependent RNA methyltransferase [Bacteroidetes bacterium]|nr:class I SAM-dependent RNA methyltransferase [Bacteroidota bacterium]
MENKSDKYTMIATTFFGLESILADELTAIGATKVEPINRAVSFEGNKSTMYKANYLCYTAIRILKPIASFTCADENELYDQLLKIEWWNYMDVDQTLAIHAVVSNSVITHSKFAALKSKDAVVDAFRNKYGRRPNVDVDNPDLQINIHIFRENCSVSLDSSGSSLHKRGYRGQVDKAPLNEVLAAGLVKLSEWNGQTDLIDPMCGSGTLLIEAAMQAYGIPAGFYRKDFGFMYWNDFDKDLWEEICKEALLNQKDFNHQIIGIDHSFKAISIAKENLISARFHKDIELRHTSFEELPTPFKNGTLITNPPYGDRLEESDIIGLYKMIGDQLKTKYAGFKAWVLSGNLDALKFVGLRPSKKIIVFNGPIECRFAKFEVYEGSRKFSKSDQNPDRKK